MSREEKFFEMCTTLPFAEKKDTRDESSIPELIHVAELRDSGNMQDAIDYANALIRMYPDNDLIPFMVAYIYYQKDFPQEALKTAIDAIPKCLRKYRLYSVAGLAEFSRDRLPEAIVWWSRSIVAQCAVVDFQECDPFLYMAHAGQVVGAAREAQMLFTMVDAIESETPRLGGEAIDKLMSVKQSWMRDTFVRVLKHIDQNYLHG